MTAAIFLNRRSGHDRRSSEQFHARELRLTERRSPNSDNYMLLIGDGGIDRFTMVTAGLLALLLILFVFAITPSF
jgi:hypothetical protein